MLPAFDLLQPSTLNEALEWMAARPKLTPIAGGTSLLVSLRGGREAAETLLDLGRLDELRGIEIAGSELVIGARTTVSAILQSQEVAARIPLLTQACSTFAAPLVRNRATIGGNLADASPAADLAPPLLALDAEIELRSVKGKRLVPIAEFFVGLRKTNKAASELVTAIHVPLPKASERTAYRKLGLRKADAISVVSAAIRVGLCDDGICDSARIALGSVAPVPMRARETEAALRGQRLTEEVIASAAGFAAETVLPIDDLRASATYRKRMVETLVRRLLSEVKDGA